ncbi:caspase family protein [Chryseobacterium sp. EZn1]|uniref:caspase family protein n=1 Tax=Chryseobacterium cupriresistens TaxID=3366770 RepID=UPI003984E095
MALVVGCSEYEFAGHLENPLNDVKSVKESLESLGFDVMYIENPTLKKLKIGIDDFGTELEKYDVGLFYFAGHGVQVKGLNYLIPVDANLKNERTVEYDCVRVDRILSHMESAKTSVNLIILDACRNNPFERNWGRELGQKGFAVMDAPKGSLIAYSTSPGKTASDGEGKNGLYTGELISEIKSVNVTITQLFQKVRKSVMEKSKDEQVPWESTSLTADFYFNRK